MPHRARCSWLRVFTSACASAAGLALGVCSLRVLVILADDGAFGTPTGAWSSAPCSASMELTWGRPACEESVFGGGVQAAFLLPWLAGRS